MASSYSPTGGVKPVKPGKGSRRKTGYRVGGKNLYDVPYGAYDPSLEAQRLASERGLSDLREDTRTANRWAKRDFKTDLFNIGRGWNRAKQDMRRGLARNRQKIGFQRDDLRKNYGRAREDFASQLAGIGRQFSRLSDSQEEARNAAGTLSGGTGAAAALKRAENQRFAEQPIHTAESRTGEDFRTSLGRINVAENQLTQDFTRGWNRGKQDVRQNRNLTRRSYGRGVFERDRKEQRGIREQLAGEADIAQQKIWSARQTNPGAFTKYGKKKKR